MDLMDDFLDFKEYTFTADSLPSFRSYRTRNCNDI